MAKVLLFIWIVGICSQCCLLLRGWRSAALRRYPFFFTYVASSLVANMGFIPIVWLYRSYYSQYYWTAEFLTLAFGCGLVFEIFRNVLAQYRGAHRFARAVCLTTFVSMFLAFFILPGALLGNANGSVIDLERDIRAAQIFFFVGIVAVVVHYRIPLGRNIQGLIFGYGLYLGTNLLSLTVRSYLGLGFDSIWNVLQPASFTLSQAIWVTAFWSYSPNPLPANATGLEEDYESLVSRTSLALKFIRQQATRAIR